MRDLLPLDERLLTELPPKMVLAWRAIPLAAPDDGPVAIATTRPDDPDLLANLEALFKRPVTLRPCSDRLFDESVQRHFGIGAGALDDVADDRVDSADAVEPVAGDGGMARFLSDLIDRAYIARATDIHIEPFDARVDIRFRIDGLLRAIPVPAALYRHRQTLASRVKVLARLNIAERRLPQDGRFRVAVDGDEIDVRVSTLPTMHGESIDLRLLPRRRMALGLKKLGMPARHLETLDRLIRKPNGIILVTGPTGHGKTTTLYSCLSELNVPEKKIITVEDPVEVRLPGVNQVQIHPKIGLTFAAGLRSILRQDPDVIMVGEIRDAETAESAVRASLTGHLVFSTLHTNDAIGAVARLLDMGIEPYLLAASLSAVLGQRLIRIRCAPCEAAVSPECDRCLGTGFAGRTGIFELLTFSEPLRALVAGGAPLAALRAQAAHDGFESLILDGRRKRDAGETTEAEILRVAAEL